MHPDVAVFVLSAPGRPETTARCLDSLRASDLGAHFVVCTQELGQSPLEHWTNVFRSMAEVSAPLVLLLEDDCIANRHVLHNVRSWVWPHHPSFGAGWLYNPGGYLGGSDCWYGGTPAWYGSVAVLYWTADVTAIRELALRWMAEQKNQAWDCAVAWAVHWQQKRIRVHGPPLFEHMHQEPSLIGHRHTWSYSTTRGSFKLDWQRTLRSGQAVVPVTGRDPSRLPQR